MLKFSGMDKNSEGMKETEKSSGQVSMDVMVIF